jgi:hypothetical protein
MLYFYYNLSRHYSFCQNRTWISDTSGRRNCVSVCFSSVDLRIVPGN